MFYALHVYIYLSELTYVHTCICVLNKYVSVCTNICQFATQLIIYITVLLYYHNGNKTF